MSNQEPNPEASPELLPCPFCGGEPYLDETNYEREGIVHFVICRSCGCEGPWSKHESGAERLWNVRVSNATDDANTRAQLEAHGLMALYHGCDTVQWLCEEIRVLRNSVERLKSESRQENQ